MKGASGLRALAITSLLLAVIAIPQGSTASPAAATTITVNTTDDELNTDGDCSLREAIEAANTDTAVDACTAGSGADTIDVPSGTYTLAVSGANEEANATGDLDVTADLTITGAGSGSTTVTGPAGWDDRIFDVGLLANAAVTISGLTVSGGNSDASGGGIRGNGFSLDLTLSDVVLSANTAAGDGGGLFSSSLGNLVLTNMTATGNTSVGNGGGIRTANASSSMTNLGLTDNRTSGGEGGGLYVQDQSATITGLTATGNTAFSSGGLVLSGAGLGVLEDATISGNTADSIGGGLSVGDGWTIRRASISGNQSVAEAGGVLAGGAGIVIEDTTIDGNIARQPSVGTSFGGGIRFGAGSLTLERVAVTNNTATGFGGGIFVNPGAIQLTNVTISGNSGGGFAGGGTDTSNAPVLRNSTIADNSAGACEAGTPSQCGSAIDTFQQGVVVLENDIVAGPAPLCSSSEDTRPRPEIVSNGHNLYSGPCVLVMGPGDRTADPLLGPLADNGGPTKTHALLPGSPAIDPHGPSDPGPSNCPATDQRGVTRPQDGDLDGTPICDIGAYELVPLGPADLALAKDDGKTSVTAGSSTSYTITLTNNGPSSVPAGVVVKDTIPAGTSGSEAEADCAIAAGVFSCTTSAALAPSASVSYRLTLAVDPGFSAATLANTATIDSSPAPDPEPGNDSATDTDMVVRSADLKLAKDDGKTSVTAGGATTYTIRLTNTGPSSVPAGVVVKDTIPAGTSGSEAEADCAIAGGVFSCTTSAALAPSASVSYRLTLAVDPGYSGAMLVNTATIDSSPAPDPEPGNDSATDTDMVVRSADLKLAKDDGKTSVTAGGATTYTITLTNNGPSSVPAGVVVKDTIPAGTSGSEAEADCAIAAGVFSCTTSAALAPSASVSYRLTLAVDPGYSGAMLVNTATIDSSPAPDPEPGNNSATDTDMVVGEADLAITKRDAPDPVDVGSNLTYTIDVRNDGPSDAQAVVVSDTLPAGTTFGSASDGGAYDPATNRVNWSFSSFVSGQTRQLTLTVGVKRECRTSLTNGVSVSSSLTPDPASANNSATEATAIRSKTGTSANEVILGGAGNEVILGGAGNDTLKGGGGDDVLCGEGGNDVLVGDGGNDLMFGGNHDGVHDDVVDGVDRVSYADYRDPSAVPLWPGSATGWLIDLSSGVAQERDNGTETDTLRELDDVTGSDVGAGSSFAPDAPPVGRTSNDRIIGDADANDLRGIAGIDSISAGAGADMLLGGLADDALNGEAGRDTINGGGGNDDINGDNPSAPRASQNADTIDGGSGDDTIAGRGGDDLVFGGLGSDDIGGGDGDDKLSGEQDNDLIHGRDGDDEIWGGGGMDALFGDAGRDRMAGDAPITKSGVPVSAEPTAIDGLPDLVAGGGDNDLIYGQGGNDCSSTKKDPGIPKWCPDTNEFTISVAGTTFGPFIAELEGQDGLDRLHGGPGNDRVDGGPEGGNALVGYTGTDLCSFGPPPGDTRDISCELPVADPDDRVDIPWERWDWIRVTKP